ncbi:hypothetical protein ACFFX0_08275 [Citricoccus parietis]|uniref:Uncharacterized protein n=1 Tax=Citricoccus parietis TaxID=592307 RepID=A0ABV5FWZ5_9MICC
MGGCTSSWARPLIRHPARAPGSPGTGYLCWSTTAGSSPSRRSPPPRCPMWCARCPAGSD